MNSFLNMRNAKQHSASKALHHEKHAGSGFTLIELLVVIAIISLLVSILLPSLTKAKDLAKQVACMSNMNHVGLCFQYYCDDNEEIYPKGWNDPSDSSDDKYIWHRVVSVYAPVSESSTFWDKRNPVAPGEYLPGGIWSCPAFDFSQAINVADTLNYINAYNNAVSWRKESELHLIHSRNKGPAYTPLYIENHGGAYCFYIGSSSYLITNLLDYRHLDGMNRLFVDGHVDFSTFHFAAVPWGDYIEFARGNEYFE